MGESARTVGCPPVILYFARGSSQVLAGTVTGFGRPGHLLSEELRRHYGTKVIGTMGDAYPAVAVTPRSMLGKGYRRSVESGVESARQNVADLTMLCPGSWFVLGGFSQGAQVIRTALDGLNETAQRRIAAVALFGDPYFDAAERTVIALSNYRRARRGALRKLRPAGAPAIGVRFAGRVFSWCHDRDLICQSAGSLASHETYERDVGEAVTRIAGRLAALGVSPEVVANASKPYEVRGTCLSGTCALAEWGGPGKGFEARSARFTSARWSTSNARSRAN